MLASSYVEETYWTQHDGAKFVGPFNRIEFARSQPQHPNAPAAIRSYEQRLPLHATDVYYRDEIGVL